MRPVYTPHTSYMVQWQPNRRFSLSRLFRAVWEKWS
jgi:hypothetical protein